MKNTITNNVATTSDSIIKKTSIEDVIALIGKTSLVKTVDFKNADGTYIATVKYVKDEGDDADLTYSTASASEYARIRKADRERREKKTRASAERPAPLKIKSIASRVASALASYDKTTKDLEREVKKLEAELKTKLATLEARKSADDTKRKTLVKKDAEASYKSDLVSVLVHNATKTDEGRKLLRDVADEYCFDVKPLEAIVETYASGTKDALDDYAKEAVKDLVDRIATISVIAD